MPFVKGQSGNPSGRPKALIDLQTHVRAQTEDNIRVMMELRDGAEDQAIRLRAAVALHEIAWGKPKQQVDMEATHQAGDTLLAALEKIAVNGNAR